MLGVLFLIPFLFLLNQLIFGFYQKRHSFFDRKKMNLLYLYHIVFYGIYLWYALNNASDSKHYFYTISNHKGSWLELFGTDTSFIHFLGFPFYKLGINSYESLMFIFSWFGYLGFVYAYLFFREKIPIGIKVFHRINFLVLILFLPNMHFWSASLGKGAPVFLGLMMFSYAIINPKKRIFLLILSSILIFHIRPHVFMFVAVGAAIGYMSGSAKMSTAKKLLISGALLGSVLAVQDQILAVAGLGGSEDLLQDFDEFADKRASGLADAGSGVDMSSYPLPLKLFTFWFRPLFIDAPNVLGVIVSIENLLYLFLVLKIIRKDFIRFVRKSPAIVKMSLVIFLGASLAMTFIMSNLGLIMRQKSMVMYFLFFVIYYYLAQKKYSRLLRLKKMKLIRKNLKEKEIAPA